MEFDCINSPIFLLLQMRQKQTFLAANMFNLENAPLVSIQLDLCDRQRSLIAVLSPVLCVTFYAYYFVLFLNVTFLVLVIIII